MLTNNEILKQIEEGNIIIDNLKENSLEKPNSCNISIENILYTYDYQIVDTKKKNNYLKEINSGNLKNLRKIEIPKEGLLLEPNKIYLAKTNEKVKTQGYVPVLHGRNSLSLLGLSIELNSGYAEDNFNDNFILSIIATKPTIIYPNIEIGNLTFFRSIENTSNTIGMLGGNEIKRMIKTKDIEITPSDNIVINPNSINLSLNENIGIYTEPVLDIKKKNTFETITIPEEGLVLYPNEIYLLRSNEWVSAKNLIPMMSGRSSLGRLGLHVHCSAGMGSIGYSGYWHMSVRATIPIRVYPNMKCCQIYYYTPDGKITNTYNGSMKDLDGNELGSQSHIVFNDK